MSKLGQKEAVVAEVLTRIPTFQKGQDVAITMLSATQLEDIKSVIYQGIINGHIEYSKDVTNLYECKAYARSMVMNHLKKAKELNGGSGVSASAPRSPTKSKDKTVPDGVDINLVPTSLQDFVKSLV